MKVKDAIILFLGNDKQIKTITSIQKILYIVQERGMIDKKIQFKNELYGPYCHILIDELEILRTRGYLDYNTIDPHRRYDEIVEEKYFETGDYISPKNYFLTEKGKVIREKLMDKCQSELKKFKKIIDDFTPIYRKLERIYNMTEKLEAKK